MSLCPADCPAPTWCLYKIHPATCWYSTRPLRYHKLGTTVARLCKSAGVRGYKTNHSFRVTAVTRLYDWWTFGRYYWALVFVLTKEHLKPNVKQFQTSLVQRGSAFNTPSLPNNLNPVNSGAVFYFGTPKHHIYNHPSIICFPFMLICYHVYYVNKSVLLLKFSLCNMQTLLYLLMLTKFWYLLSLDSKWAGWILGSQTGFYEPHPRFLGPYRNESIIWTPLFFRKN